MIRFPTVRIEGRKLPRIIFSLRPSISAGKREILPLMEESYEMGVWCFDLLSTKDLEGFRELKRLTDDETLISLCHLEAEEGVSFLGKPLHRFESKVVSTIKKSLASSNLIRTILPASSPEVFTQKEIDRIAFDPLRFEKALVRFSPQVCPFLLVGERYGDWLLALGRIDLLREMVSKVRGKGFIPIFSGQWATFSLPKAKSLDVAAYAVPINKQYGLFDLDQACHLIKKFDRPVISLNALADGRLFSEPEQAFSFLFDELKVYSAIVEIDSEKTAGKVLEASERIPSLTPHRKTG